MITLLSYFNIFASKCLEKPKVINYKEFHTIQISRKYAKVFKDNIGFVVKEKQDGLNQIIDYLNRPNRKDEKDVIDKIPCIDKLVVSLGRDLNINTSSWRNAESIGRRTLMKYIDRFEEQNKTSKSNQASDKIDLLKQAAFSDVVWDKIVKLEYLDDPHEFVYDFTVPGNDSFMVDTGVLVHNTLNTSIRWKGWKSPRGALNRIRASQNRLVVLS
jgi:intein/homing endonuclease